MSNGATCALGPVHHDIKEMLGEGRAFWAGCRPPQGNMSSSDALYDPHGDFRLPPALHQAFQLVYLVERDLAGIKQWPLVLDEALRLLEPGGILRVRFSESALLSVFQFANFLQKWTGGALELVSQARRISDYEFSVRLTHRVRRVSELEAVAFAVVTDGRKPTSVRNFVRSVRQACAGRGLRYEILICGPYSVMEHLEAPSDVTLVPQPEAFSKAGWISEKKNLLVDAASAPIIVVTHDRYEVPDGFIEALDAFGADFDVLAPRQVTTDGEPIPDWVTLSDDLNWTTPAWLQHGDYHPYVYANGGALIARRSVLRKVQWSPLLFWGQGEDVDLSRRLADAGAVLRFSRNVTLVSAPPRAGFIEGFERLPWLDDVYAQSAPTPGIVRRGPLGVDRTSAPAAIVDVDVPLKDLRPDVASTSGFVFPRSWRPSPAGLRWSGVKGDKSNWFSFRLPDTGSSYSLYVEHEGRSQLQLTANGARCKPSGVRGGFYRFELPNAIWQQSRIVHVFIQASSDEGIVLRRVRLEGDDHRYALDRALFFTPKTPEIQWLGQGWEPSPAGACMVAPRATMTLRFARRPASDLKVLVEMKALEVDVPFRAEVFIDGAYACDILSAPRGETSTAQFSISRPFGRKVVVDFIQRSQTARRLGPVVTLMRVTGAK